MQVSHDRNRRKEKYNRGNRKLTFVRSTNRGHRIVSQSRPSVLVNQSRSSFLIEQTPPCADSMFLLTFSKLSVAVGQFDTLENSEGAFTGSAI